MPKCSEYLIQVSPEPHLWDNLSAPYRWSVLGSRDGGEWTAQAGGWADTMDRAFHEARQEFRQLSRER